MWLHENENNHDRFGFLVFLFISVFEIKNVHDDHSITQNKSSPFY